MPAWLTFTGAIAVALIAAAAAQWRLRAQLRHDCELKDLDELRDLLDECALVSARASQLMIKFLNRARTVGREPGHPDDDEPPDRPAGAHGEGEASVDEDDG